MLISKDLLKHNLCTKTELVKKKKKKNEIEIACLFYAVPDQLALLFQLGFLGAGGSQLRFPTERQLYT